MTMDLSSLNVGSSYAKAELCRDWHLESQVRFAVVLGTKALALFLNREHEIWCNEFEPAKGILTMQYQGSNSSGPHRKRNERIRASKQVGDSVALFWRDDVNGDFQYKGLVELAEDIKDVNLFVFGLAER